MTPNQFEHLLSRSLGRFLVTFAVIGLLIALFWAVFLRPHLIRQGHEDDRQERQLRQMYPDYKK
jgi:hypothetical protein